MKAKSSLIREYRTKRMWSQEQLAAISGLGLRTIQRIETRGNTSLETIKALAAVFEVDANTLVWKDDDDQVYQHKQWSFVICVIIPLIATLLLALNYIYDIMQPTAMGIFLGLLIIVILPFSSMTIEVNESEIKWFFGPGLFCKSLLIEQVDKCGAVRNSIWMGFGIHALPTGWIYNVSGFLGVEIKLKGGAFIRLGTDEPNYLVTAIEDFKTNT